MIDHFILEHFLTRRNICCFNAHATIRRQVMLTWKQMLAFKAQFDESSWALQS